MSYAMFLLIFIIAPMIPLIYNAMASKAPSLGFNLKGIGVLCVLAFVYTTPWDNYLVAKEVWWYGPERVAFVIGYVPIEEYAFFFLQTIFTGLWCLFLQSKIRFNREPSKNKNLKIAVLAGMSAMFALGVYSLTQTNMFYMGLILAWALPILILQFAIGGQYLLSNLKLFLWTIIPSSVYLCLTDAYAIWDGIWTISEAYTIGLKFGVLPLEEALFFLITNLMVAQGLILFNLMKDHVILTWIKSRSFA